MGGWAETRLDEVAARKAELLGQLPDEDTRNTVFRAALREQNLRGGRFTERLAEEVANWRDANGGTR